MRLVRRHVAAQPQSRVHGQRVVRKVRPNATAHSTITNQAPAQHLLPRVLPQGRGTSPPIMSCTHIALELSATLYISTCKNGRRATKEVADRTSGFPHGTHSSPPSFFVLLRSFLFLPWCFISWLVILGSSSRRRSWEIPLLWRNATATTNQRVLGQTSMN
jgi:hypothetical protein